MSKAFTLLETIIALFILTAGILSVIGLILTTTRSLALTKDQTIAANLAQEGIEIVRSIRDTNWLEAEEFNNGLAPGDYCSDYTSSSLSLCSNFGLIWDGTGYAHGVGSQTPFARSLHIENGADEQGINFVQVTSTVSWGASNSINTQDRLYDWR